MLYSDTFDKDFAV